ncbi:site-specific integrase [Plantibacter sp. Mn2098]|uniref:site-specific integrase n=1 Tax=Plantibacter sp. Mn2098 TaxID=3395266 RepID=UPI003BC848DF
MARPPLILETWGTIRRTTRNGKPAAVTYYRDSDGVTRLMERQGATPAAAERALITALKERLAPAGDDLTGDSTIRSLGKLWMEETEERDLAPGTLVKYREILNGHIVKGLGDVRLNEANVPRLDRYLKALAKRSGPSTARLARVVMSQMFALATRHGAVKGNPVRDVATVKVARKPVQAPTSADAQAILARLTEWDQGRDGRGAVRNVDLSEVAWMFVATGARTGELLALKWESLDLASTPPTVSIERTIALNDEGRLTVQDHPKTATSIRVLKLPAFATEMLLARRLESTSEFVFPSSSGTWRSPNNFRTQWRAALKGTEWQGISPRAFRKAVATVVRDHLGVGAAKDQLGHSSEQVTNSHYVRQRHEGPDATAVLQDFATKTMSK